MGGGFMVIGIDWGRGRLCDVHELDFSYVNEYIFPFFGTSLGAMMLPELRALYGVFIPRPSLWSVYLRWTIGRLPPPPNW